ncbi:MAG TPA: ABC transporter ATP-binding protein [Streptosporangiaceae bacterium]|nr:ABC transporter ATP-binding protein [Streptosporangiaceae bacterium]
MQVQQSGAAGQGTSPAGGAAAVTLSEVSKVYGRGPSALLAVDRLSLTVAAGEFVCLVGASGCGKSTLLSMVAGLDRPTAGTVDIAGRRVAIMFQEPALFPWLTAQKNVELALRARKVPAAQRRKASAARRRKASAVQRRDQAAALLASVHLADFGAKRPHELSGGMRQRVALARALAQDADVLLMDEPFGALDAMTRDLLHEEIERISAERHLTVLFVTHNVREAARLGDRVVLLSSRPGRVIEQYLVPRTGPRRIDSVAVAELAGTITDRLREEMRRHDR